MQVYGRLYRPRPKLQPSGDLRLQEPKRLWVQPIERCSAQLGKNAFRFLNEEHEIQTWNDSGIPKLWLYNLHYFDHPNVELIERWITENPVGSGNGWEAYPLSLRIVNWIKWALTQGQLSQRAASSLYIQTEYLSHTLEHHLGANHLLANAVALSMAGMYFDGNLAAGWRELGTRLLRDELAEQVLSDGGHYERSPMYHALILESLLDLINVAHAYDIPVEQDQCFWLENARKMLAWLRNMAHPDSRIAFFNDSTFGIAAEIFEQESYAQRLEIRPAILPLGSSGYVRLGVGQTVVLFDGGAIGPDHQPGHAHADTLSFELSHEGRRVLVNSGISTYEKGLTRQWQRGTAAHNTLRVDGLDQSEVWSSFRVARRARAFDVQTDGCTFVEAAHDGYSRLPRPVVHRRRLKLDEGRLTVTDRIEGRGYHDVELFFYFHPEIRPSIHLDQKLAAREQYSSWHPGFNLSIQNKSVAGTWSGHCPVEFVTSIPLS